MHLCIHGCTLRTEEGAGDSESGFTRGCEQHLYGSGN